MRVDFEYVLKIFELDECVGEDAIKEKMHSFESLEKKVSFLCDLYKSLDKYYREDEISYIPNQILFD